MKPHWPNPWEGKIVYVPIEELAECHSGIGQLCGRMDGTSFILTKEEVLAHWRTYGDKLDAYILPQPSGFHDMGVRFGAQGQQYLSPLADKQKITALLKRYQ